MRPLIFPTVAITFTLIGCASPAMTGNYPGKDNDALCGAKLGRFIYADSVLAIRTEKSLRTEELSKAQELLARKRMEAHPSAPFLLTLIRAVGDAAQIQLHTLADDNLQRLFKEKRSTSGDYVAALTEFLPQFRDDAQSQCKRAGRHYELLTFAQAEAGKRKTKDLSEANQAVVKPEITEAEPRPNAAPPQRLVEGKITSPNPSEAIEPIISFGDNQSFLKDIKAMRTERLVKDGFESTADFAQRKQQYFARYKKGKGYRISLKIDNGKNEKNKLVSFNPDTEEVQITLPRISRDLGKFYEGETSEFKWIHHSFVEIDSIEHKVRKYEAKNRLGASINVVEMSSTKFGLAVLSQATEDYSKDFRQTFTTRIPKAQARGVLEKGEVILEVVLDPRYPSAEGSPFLLKEATRDAPTFDRPIDIKETRYAVPVRLLKIRLLNEVKAEIFSAVGQYIDAKAIHD